MSLIDSDKKRKVGRVGEVNRSKAGQLMKIIAYRNAMDIDIQFEDGAVVRNKSYGNFKNGHIRNYNSKCYDTTVKLDNIIGETVVNKAEQEIIGQVVVFSTSAISKRGYKLMKRELKTRKIPVADEHFYCKGQFYGLHKGYPDAKDLEKVIEFTNKVLTQ